MRIYLFLTGLFLLGWPQLTYSITVTFQVDMRALVSAGIFNPQTETVDIAGNFNGWGTSLQVLQATNQAHIWETTLSNFTAGQTIEFKFRINGAWNGREEFPGAGNNRSLIIPNQDTSMTYVYNKLEELVPIRPTAKDTSELAWRNDAIFYEIFVRSFYDSDGDGIGDFQGIIQKLDYLNDGDPNTDTDLGITGIWLMPINPSPSYHGYDVTNYREINPDYGSMADFKAFVAAAHARGIRVIIDFVVNHTSTRHPWFANARAGAGATYRDWYRWTGNHPGYRGPWGQDVWHEDNGQFYYGLFWGGMPDLNYETPAVKDELFSITDFWLKEVGIDGFRLDAVKYLYEDGEILEDVPATFTFFDDFHQRIKAAKADAFSVGEAWTSTEKVVKYVENDQIDYCFEFDLANSILQAVQNGNNRFLSYQVTKAYHTYPYLQWGSFLTNHDQNRVMNVLSNDIQKLKTAAALYLTLPGVPYLYYGEEIGMNGVKPDEDIRLPMQWTAGTQAGFTSGTPWRAPHPNYRTFNVAQQQSTSGSIWQWYRDLIAIRHDAAPLRKGYYRSVETQDERVYAFLRTWAGDTVLTLINLSNQSTSELQVDIPPTGPAGRTLYDYISGLTNPLPASLGDAPRFPGMNPNEVRIYAFGRGPLQTQQLALESVQVFPNPAQRHISVNLSQSTASKVGYHLYDLTGQLVLQGQATPQAGSFTFDLPGGASGLYLLHLSQSTHVVVKKIHVNP